MTEAAESTPAVADLLARARVYVEGSHTKQTLEAYAADWKHFSTWCEEHKRRSLPAAPETIICYLVETADSYRVATLDRRLASISYHHKQARHQLPTKDPAVERTMRGIRRAKGMAPNGKASLLPAQLRQAIDALPDTLLGKRDHPLLVIGAERTRRPAHREGGTDAGRHRRQGRQRPQPARRVGDRGRDGWGERADHHAPDRAQKHRRAAALHSRGLGLPRERRSRCRSLARNESGPG